jgi:hypothetical protein
MAKRQCSIRAKVLANSVLPDLSARSAKYWTSRFHILIFGFRMDNRLNGYAPPPPDSVWHVPDR